MADLGVKGLFLGAIKPVGEKILLSFRLGQTNTTPNVWTASTDLSYDFAIEQNYIVTGLEITKTVARLSASVNDKLDVIVGKVSETGALQAIAQCSFNGTVGLLGAKQRAGVALGAITVGTGSGNTNLFGDIGASKANATDPEIAVVANKKGGAATGNSQQKIRIHISGVKVDNDINPDCFIEVQLAKFVESTAIGNVQLGEVITPSVVA